MTLLEELLALLKAEAPVFVPVVLGEPVAGVDLCEQLAAELQHRQDAGRDEVEQAVRSLAPSEGEKTLKLLVREGRILFIALYHDVKSAQDYRDALVTGLTHPYEPQALEVELERAHSALFDNLPVGSSIGEGSTARIVAHALGIKETRGSYLAQALRALGIIEILSGGHHTTYRMLQDPGPITAERALEGSKLAANRPALEKGVRDDTCMRMLLILRGAADPGTGQLPRRPSACLEDRSRMGSASIKEHLGHLRAGGFVGMRGGEHFVRLPGTSESSGS